MRVIISPECFCGIAERQAFAETISNEDMAADLKLLEEIEAERKNTTELAQQQKYRELL